MIISPSRATRVAFVLVANQAARARRLVAASLVLCGLVGVLLATHLLRERGPVRDGRTVIQWSPELTSSTVVMPIVAPVAPPPVNPFERAPLEPTIQEGSVVEQRVRRRHRVRPQAAELRELSLDDL
jgi:hypothetical protein